MTEDHSRFARDIKRHLDQNLDNLDEGVLSRLRHARVSALADAPSRSMRRWPVGAAALVSAAALAVAVGVWFYPSGVSHEGFPLEDLELLATAEDPQVYEDLDFYYWLETQE